MFDVTDYFVMVVGFAVVAIVVYGGYHRAVQKRQQDGHDTTPTNHQASGVPAE
ncbi:MAG: hypothetical protein ABJM26_18460 [Anderseniella sp.]